ncbi:heavy metal-responsive transcriptional regulator [uncultured Microbacterium sp.]|uniref:heavy metal-responsive transcriptional regulator n=1 Tax=uncultured Microbacterium sp. TaxID=191216 RepID=UPI00262B0743|nr:heavy metal-responsive transcriptional regulator [uncultured Microbacterium sp.]
MRIGEAAAASGMTTKTLRFYESSGLLPATERAANGYRDYGADITARLDFIRRSRTAGLTLAQIRDILQIRDVGEAPCIHVRDLLARQLADLDRQIAELVALRATVADFYDAASEPDLAACDPDRICSYL